MWFCYLICFCKTCFGFAIDLFLFMFCYVLLGFVILGFDFSLVFLFGGLAIVGGRFAFGFVWFKCWVCGLLILLVMLIPVCLFVAWV